MIGYLKGVVREHRDGRMLIVVGDSVGYSVHVPSSAEYGRFSPGQTIELSVYTHVREDTLDLYGFAAETEKEMYLTLLTVNGIGPKGALGILSKVSTQDLVQAIVSGDKAALTRIPGIGKKTAERVVLELADSLGKKGLVAHPEVSHATPRSRHQSTLNDAREALVGLGYREADVSTLLKKIAEESDEESAALASAEVLIMNALKRLGTDSRRSQ